ncbi:metallophosphoesterase [Corynebacterium caspium]|uniref:metallophosphoesterase n=1 Tax=Corynebacterium caspium TaxID=234828 RepID=UPI000381F0EB|nr:metallophosphoesterase [Corynebacterium caspium]WKD58558.1 phosphodiesterase YaeI [Corynebacterium caspium DSM 44850]
MQDIIKKLAALTGTAALSGIAAAAWGYRELTNFQLHEYTLPRLSTTALKRLENGTEFRILHISDLHMIPGQEEKIAFVQALAEFKPDLVVNTGDNLSDLHAVPAVIRALEPLLPLPGLFVFGTNDYWAPRFSNPLKYLTGTKREPSYVDLPWQGMRAAFIEHGWLDANNKRQEFTASGLRLAVAGVDDPHHNLDNYPAIAGAPNPQADLNLALLHSPEPRVLRKFAADGYDLALAGHTHGGQICLPGERAIITNCGIDRARASGLSVFDDMLLHVSNGLGTSKYAPIRLFCPPSATLLRFTAQP